MVKLVFTPFSIVTGIVAGLVGKKIFRSLWGVVDDAEPPKPDERPVPIGKLVTALAIEGALFRLVKGLVDHGSRHAFSRLTGSWPGDLPQEPK
jgi:hypothetical protein